MHKAQPLHEGSSARWACAGCLQGLHRFVLAGTHPIGRPGVSNFIMLNEACYAHTVLHIVLRFGLDPQSLIQSYSLQLTGVTHFVLDDVIYSAIAKYQ